jgi:hypothetical protein
MGSLENRITRLEGRIELPEDPGAELRRAVLHDILDELNRLKAARARGCYRGGNPPTPIQPTDPAGEVLGYPYTRGQFTELAIRRVFERERGKAPDILTREMTEELIHTWTEMFRDRLGSFELGWDEVECWEPPEPTPPWHERHRLSEGRGGGA